ncbi:hypothetical protein GTW38_12715, partial [Streptomyces sp. SID7804]|nr:hypothetical protein [Streptomyces sp. SID7804]
MRRGGWCGEQGHGGEGCRRSRGGRGPGGLRDRLQSAAGRRGREARVAGAHRGAGPHAVTAVRADVA